MSSFIRVLLSSLALLLLVVSLGVAQEATPNPVPSSAPQIAPDPDLRSPRASVTTFMTSMAPGESPADVDVPRAMKTLDTSELPEMVRLERSAEIAAKLYAILSFKELALSKVPSSSSLGAVEILAIDGSSVTLERIGPNWKFSRATVADVPAIFRKVEANLSKKELRQLSDSVGPWLTISTYVPESLKGAHFFLEDWQWLAGALAILLLAALHFTVVRIAQWFVAKFILRRVGTLHGQALVKMKRPIFVIVLATAIELFVGTIDLPVNVYSQLLTWISTIRVIAVVFLAIRIIDMTGDGMRQTSRASSTTVDELLFPLVQKALWLFAIAVGIVQVLTIHGVNVSGLVAGLGLGGLAFALAAKDTVENVFGSAAILVDRPFKVGDNIVVGGVTGTVEKVGLRTTRLRTADNSLVSMPNSKVIASHVDNLGARSYLRTRFLLPFPFGTPSASLVALSEAIRELLRSHPAVKQDAIAVYVNEVTTSGVGVLVQYFLDVKDWPTEQERKEEIFIAILLLCETLGVRPTSPEQTLHLVSTPRHAPEPPGMVSTEAAVTAARGLAVGWTRMRVG